MHYQTLSNLFLHSSTFPRIRPLSSNLILAGNIGHPGLQSYEPFLRYISSNWANVFYVCGAYEYTNCFSPFHRLQEIRKVAFPHKNIHLLQKQTVFYKDMPILGCSLWSPQVNKNVFQNEQRWIQTEMKKYTEMMIITHYPLYTRENRFHYTVEESCKVKSWIYGVYSINK